MSQPLDLLHVMCKLLFTMVTGKSSMGLSIDTVEDACKHILVYARNIDIRLKDYASLLQKTPHYYSSFHKAPFVFVLNQELQIIGFNLTVSDCFQFSDFFSKSLLFESILDSPSKALWLNVCPQALDQGFGCATLALVFVTGNEKFLPMICSVSQAFDGHKIFIISLDSPFVYTTLQSSSYSSLSQDIQTEVETLAKIRDYLLDQLHEPLPSLESLSLDFGISVHKIKQGFKKYYHCSVYQFYQQERLQKAYYLILQTDFLLKDISYQCGFDHYLNFYKAFKKKYGLSPVALKQIYRP